MADWMTILAFVAINGTLAYVAVRVAWWAFKKVIGGTGKAWRGE